MTEKPTRRRRRILLVPLLGLGVAAWVVRSRLGERRRLQEGWQPLPPRPVPARSPAAAAPRSGRARRARGRARRARAVPAAADRRARPAAAPCAGAVPAAAALRRSAPASGALRALTDGSSPDAEYTVKGKTATRVPRPGQPVLQAHPRRRLVPHRRRRPRRRVHRARAARGSG